MACLGILAFSAADAIADDSAPIVHATVYKAGGGTEPDAVTPAQLRATPSQCPTYSGGQMTEYGRQGQVTVTPDPRSTWTIATILGCMQTPIALADVTGITVINSDGAPMTASGSQLMPLDLKTPSDFQDASQTPVITAVGSTDQYDRPWRGGSDLDFLDETQTTPIAIEVFEGPLLTVTATASPTTVNVGGTVQFKATASGGSGLAYNWSFGGGAASSTEESPTVQFNTAGVWTINLEVTDANGGGGGDQVTVTVNQPGTSSTPTATGPTNTGPNKSTGTTPNAPASTKKPNKGTQTTGNHHTHGKGQGNTSTHTQTTTTSTTTTSTTTSQTTTTPASGGSSGGPSGSSGSPGAGASPAPTTSTPAPAPGAGAHHRAPRAPTHHPASTPAQGTLVDGELISDVVTLPADRSPLVHLLPAATAAAPARQAPESRSHIAVIAAAILAVLALLGFGAQRELGYDRQWRVWLRSLRVGG